MPVHRGNIAGVILGAWRHALDLNGRGESRPDKRGRNKERSALWVDSLARRLYEHYEGDRYRLFWRGNDKNQEQFGKNEMLFDIAVCSVSTTKSRQHHAQDLEFIAQCHWQVESEFSRANTRDIVVDMSKLVMGSAENKLFVAAHRSRANAEAGVLEQCSEIAGRCTGRVYFCFVSHPDDWADQAAPPALYEWVAGGWEPVPSPQAA